MNARKEALQSAASLSAIVPQVSKEGVGEEVYTLAIEALEGQVPERAIPQCAAQLLCICAAAAGVTATAHMSKKDARFALDALIDGFRYEVEVHFLGAVEQGIIQ